MPKLLGIDPGQRRVGLATSDASQSIATPLDVIDRETAELGEALKEVVQREGIDRVIVGYPEPLKVEENERTRQVDAFIESFVVPLPVPFETFSERYSTKEARRKREQREKGGTPGDDEAAAVILQTYLDRLKDGTSSSPGSGSSHE